MKNNKVNLTAIIFACVILAILCFWARDAIYYQEVLSERRELGDEVSQLIFDKMPLDFEDIEEKRGLLEEKLLVLNDRTDLGELLVKNDETAEGRNHNTGICVALCLGIAFCGVVIFWNVIQIFRKTVRFVREIPDNTKKLQKNVSTTIKVAKATGKFEKK